MKRLFAILMALSVLALCACGAPAQQPNTEPAPTEAPAVAPAEPEDTEPELMGYFVTVLDEHDAAVFGVSVQIDNETAITDDTGLASFLLSKGTYTATIPELPYGYTISGEDESFVLTEEVRHVLVNLRSAEEDLDNAEIIEEEEPVIEEAPEEDIGEPIEELPEE